MDGGEVFGGGSERRRTTVFWEVGLNVIKMPKTVTSKSRGVSEDDFSPVNPGVPKKQVVPLEILS